MASVAEEGATGQPASSAIGRIRSALLGRAGTETTRRRASDAFRLGGAIAAVAVSVPVMQANSAAELAIAHALNPPPDALRWVVTSMFWLGSVGVIIILATVGLLVPRLTAALWITVAGLLTWGACVMLSALLGPTAGRPVTPALAGFDASYPIVWLAVAMAVAATALPYLARPIHRLAWPLLLLASLGAIIDGKALPVNAASSLLLGYGVAAAVHLAVGSPLGLLSAQDVTDLIAEMGITMTGIRRSPQQTWGVQRLAGHDAAGRPVELAVYGRDAADARAMAKLWRFCFYRDSGPTLILDRLLQVEHEAYLHVLAARAGVRVPEVLATGRFGRAGDAALATRLPDGPRLLDVDPDALSGEVLDQLLEAVLRFRQARLAHGALGSQTIIFSADGVCIRDFRCASSSAPAERLDADIAAVLGALAVRVGVERVTAAAARLLDAETTRRALVHLQRYALDPATVAAVARNKKLLPNLRDALAAAKAIEVPKLAEPKRISWVNLAFSLGMVIGVWVLVGVLGNAGGALEAIRGASWGWVAVAFVLGQVPDVTNAWATIGAVVGQLPFGRCVALETANAFTSIVGGDVAVFALRVRFFQRQGYDAETALSSGAIASTASWLAKGVLFLAALGFAADSLHAPQHASGHQTAIWVVVGVLLAAGIVTALLAVIPRLRRLASASVRPHLASIWASVKTIAMTPRKLAYVFTGAVLSQLAIALALGASLHAVGAHAGLATILVVITTASLIGGAVPVPGGAGVIEAGLIAGLTAAGVPDSQAVAAVLIQRLVTAYLPPVWGALALAWMRRREYV